MGSSSVDALRWQKETRKLQSCFVSKSGSACSPGVLSPTSEERPSLLTRRNNASFGNGSLLPSVPGCVPIDKLSSVLPLTSPSEDLTEPAVCSTPLQLSLGTETTGERTLGLEDSRHSPQAPAQKLRPDYPPISPTFDGPDIAPSSAHHLDTYLSKNTTPAPLAAGDTAEMPVTDHLASLGLEDQSGGGGQPVSVNPAITIPNASSQSHQKLLRQTVAVITPPTEREGIEWGNAKSSGQSTSALPLSIDSETPSVPIGDQSTPVSDAAAAVATATFGENTEDWLRSALVPVGMCPSGSTVNSLLEKLPGILTRHSHCNGPLHSFRQLRAISFASSAIAINTGSCFPGAHRSDSVETPAKSLDVDQCATCGPRAPQSFRSPDPTSHHARNAGWRGRLFYNQGV